MTPRRVLALALAPTLALMVLAAGCSSDTNRRAQGDATGNDIAVVTDTRPAPADSVASDTRPAPRDSSASDTASDTGGPVDTTSPGCTRNGWTPTGSTAGQLTAGATAGAYDSLYVDSYSDDVAVPYDLLGLEFYFDMGAATGPHTFTFSGENYAECHTCLLVYAGCDDNFDCTKTFLASSGTLNVSATGGDGETFHATIANVVLDEVTVDADSYESALVSGGERWCIPTFTYDTTLTVTE